MEGRYISAEEFRLRSIIANNFVEEDLLVSFNYQQGIQTDKEQAWEKAKEFIRQLRKSYERTGTECKFIYWVVRGSTHTAVKMLLKRLENHLEEIESVTERVGFAWEMSCTEFSKITMEVLAQEIMKQSGKYVVSHKVKRS